MTIKPLAYTPHNHQICINQALQQAEQYCVEHRIRLTSLRRRVFAMIWQSHKPLGAYEILNRLMKEDGRNAAPPTVYRTLDFLLENNLIHRIASLNAFIGCSHPGNYHQGYFLICSKCGNVLELKQTTVNQTIEKLAKQKGFLIKQQTVEVKGLCNYCQEHTNE